MEIINLSDFNRIQVLDIFNKELQKLFANSKDEMKKFQIYLFAQLHKIENREEHINRSEPIVYKGITLYSIRKRMKKNTRVLYYYIENGKILLLTAFDEKNKSDYDNGKERAYKRLNELKLINNKGGNTDGLY